MLYTKDGKIKDKSQIIVIKDGFQIINPSVEDILADGWVEYVSPPITIEEVRKSKIQAITEYDLSDKVNIFYLDDVPLWLNKETRVGLMNSTTIQKNNGIKESTLWFNSISYTLDCDLIISLLSAIEIYALECYNVTAKHKANIESLTSIKEIESYDYTTGYPDKLYLKSKTDQ